MIDLLGHQSLYEGSFYSRIIYTTCRCCYLILLCPGRHYLILSHFWQQFTTGPGGCHTWKSQSVVPRLGGTAWWAGPPLVVLQAVCPRRGRHRTHAHEPSALLKEVRYFFSILTVSSHLFIVQLPVLYWRIGESDFEPLNHTKLLSHSEIRPRGKGI